MDVRIDILAESGGKAECYKENVRVHPALKASATGYRGGVAVAYGIDTYNMAVTGDVSSSLGTNCGMSTGRNGVVTGVDIYNQTLTGGGIKNAE